MVCQGTVLMCHILSLHSPLISRTTTIIVLSDVVIWGIFIPCKLCWELLMNCYCYIFYICVDNLFDGYGKFSQTWEHVHPLQICHFNGRNRHFKMESHSNYKEASSVAHWRDISFWGFNKRVTATIRKLLQLRTGGTSAFGGLIR